MSCPLFLIAASCLTASHPVSCAHRPAPLALLLTPTDSRGWWLVDAAGTSTSTSSSNHKASDPLQACTTTLKGCAPPFPRPRTSQLDSRCTRHGQACSYRYLYRVPCTTVWWPPSVGLAAKPFHPAPAQHERTVRTHRSQFEQRSLLDHLQVRAEAIVRCAWLQRA